MSKEADKLLNEIACWEYELLIDCAWLANFHWRNARRMAGALIGAGI